MVATVVLRHLTSLNGPDGHFTLPCFKESDTGEGRGSRHRNPEVGLAASACKIPEKDLVPRGSRGSPAHNMEGGEMESVMAWTRGPWDKIEAGAFLSKKDALVTGKGAEGGCWAKKSKALPESLCSCFMQVPGLAQVHKMWAHLGS